MTEKSLHRNAQPSLYHLTAALPSTAFGAFLSIVFLVDWKEGTILSGSAHCQVVGGKGGVGQ